MSLPRFATIVHAVIANFAINSAAHLVSPSQALGQCQQAVLRLLPCLCEAAAFRLLLPRWWTPELPLAQTPSPRFELRSRCQAESSTTARRCPRESLPLFELPSFRSS